MITAVDDAGPSYDDVQAFLFRESELLDDWRMEDWLELLDAEVRYFVPVRVTQMREMGTGFATRMCHQDDDYPALKMRVLRLRTTAAWAENPPSRTRHMITNIRVGTRAETASGSGDFRIEVKSNLLLYRSRGDSPHYDLLAAERRDVLRQVSGSLKLLRREVLLDQSTVGTHNLAIIF
jgi:3-phenylpropionate/cinnamic acid dioxygenase small subunit